MVCSGSSRVEGGLRKNIASLRIHSGLGSLSVGVAPLGKRSARVGLVILARSSRWGVSRT